MAEDSNVTFLNADQVDFDRIIMLAESEFKLLEVCARIGQVYGVPYFSVMRLPDGTDEKLLSLGIISNWPDTLIAEYDRLGLFENSPVIKHLRTSSEPLIFDIREINENRADNKDMEAVNLFLKYDLLHGVYFSVHNSRGELAAVSFAGPDKISNHDVVVRLNYFASLIYSKLSSFGSQDKQALYDLKPRELHCLQMVSEGKSITEVSERTGWSETLVGMYLENGAMKLGCNSRIHAVSKALRLQLIK